MTASDSASELPQRFAFAASIDVICWLTTRHGLAHDTDEGSNRLRIFGPKGGTYEVATLLQLFRYRLADFNRSRSAVEVYAIAWDAAQRGRITDEADHRTGQRTRAILEAHAGGEIGVALEHRPVPTIVGGGPRRDRG